VSEITGAPKRRILVVDDDVLVGRGLNRVFSAAGFDVTVVEDGESAVNALVSTSFDVVISDIMMPGMSGVDVLKAVRARDLDVPVLLMTGNPSVETAIEAVALGALQYLPKPVSNTALLECVERASTLHSIARTKRDALKLLGASATQAGDRAGLEAGFTRSLETMWMAFQPIVDAGAREIFAYEALMRTAEPSMPNPGIVLAAAERLGRLTDIGRRVRSLSAAAFRSAPSASLLFVNLHTRDLLDPELFDPTSALATMAGRVVLEITERASLDDVPDVVERVQKLRTMGFRVAIDDLGAGYAGLSSFVALEPDFVKLDMSLVRDVHKSSVRTRLVGSLTGLCKDLGMRVLAEGIETVEERDAVRALGCDLLQGYYFAKPGRPFPELVGSF
jgi:EAL domain-containing protein (putative c-di-GMP-specific phosphodiesterase class I)